MKTSLVPGVAVFAVLLTLGCTKEQTEVAPPPPKATEEKVPLPVAPAARPIPPPKAEPLGFFTPSTLQELRKSAGFEPEDDNNLRDGRDAFLRQMGLEGRKDVKLVGLRKFFQGTAGRQEVGFIAVTRNDGSAVAMTVHAVGPIKGVPTAYAALMAPLELIATKEVGEGYMKALAALPRGPFEGEFAGYKIKAMQRGEGAETLSAIFVYPVVSPELGEPIPEPPPKPVESSCMQRCRSRCMGVVNQCVAKHGKAACAEALTAVNAECVPACKEACGG